MHIHILGICGTFMGGVAAIAKAMGHRVTGSDQHVYPPMSTQLEALGIEVIQGFQPDQLEPAPDMVVVGNVMTRGNPAVEAMLNKKLPYTSGPQWLLENVLHERWVLAVAGTHGKTTTSSMLTWILQYAGYQPGFLIGGVPQNFNESARLGESDFFVIEADEYDCAFFDKRSKFVHYRPNTLIVNNLEFDHADIFPDLASIQRQFHHLLRMVPAEGLVLYPNEDSAVQQVIQMGCWSEQQTTGKDWQLGEQAADGSQFEVMLNQHRVAHVSWDLGGQHNMHNGLMAIAAARHVGVTPDIAAKALTQFKNVKRRMELRGSMGGIHLYDDFAHHPTAIRTTLAGLRAKVADKPIIAIMELRSHTMKMGVHQRQLAQALEQADQLYVYHGIELEWDVEQIVEARGHKGRVFSDLSAMQQAILTEVKPGDNLLVMSNGGFGGLIDKLLAGLKAKYGKT